MTLVLVAEVVVFGFPGTTGSTCNLPRSPGWAGVYGIAAACLGPFCCTRFEIACSVPCMKPPVETQQAAGGDEVGGSIDIGYPHPRYHFRLMYMLGGTTDSSFCRPVDAYWYGNESRPAGYLHPFRFCSRKLKQDRKSNRVVRTTGLSVLGIPIRVIVGIIA